MRILLSNDDGIDAEGLWVLAEELSQIAQVTIAAPDREQSAVGTAVSLRKPLRVQKIVPRKVGVEAYSVGGTPSDSVIVALGKLIPEKVDLVISGINRGSNMGEDVLISGTVGAALAAYLRGFPAVAVSCFFENWQRPYLNDVARFTRLLVKRLAAAQLPGNLLLNVNMPNLPMDKAKGIRITGLAHRSHVNTVEEALDEQGAYYTLIREGVSLQNNKRSDIQAAAQGNISITPLSLFLNDRLPLAVLEKLVAGLLEEFKAVRD
jgi:5'-nucleotidase